MRHIIFIGASAMALFACSSNNEKTSLTGWPNWATSRIFTAEGKTFAPADFKSMSLSLVFRPEDGVVVGESEIELTAIRDGFAFFLSDPKIDSAELDGRAVDLKTRMDPDQLNALRVIPSELEEGETYRLKTTFTLPSERVNLHSGGVGFLTSMSDIESGNYFEAYAPANFEDDSYSLNLHLKIEGANIAPHRLFANGVVTAISSQEWRVQFPAYFTSSSLYVHLTDTPLFVHSGTHPGLAGPIPFTAYSRDADLAATAFSAIPSLFTELEAEFGPYPHSGFIAYISGRGGMEHSGATVTSVSALGHELTHSWFARGVIPSDGRSGWLDEAIASWRDNGYFRATALETRGATNLGRVSAFQRFTRANSYRDGRLFLSELDLMFADQGGLRPLLKTFFRDWQRKSISTEDFRESLERESGRSLLSLFQTYVFGGDGKYGEKILDPVRLRDPKSGHPPALTQKEVHWLR